MINVNLDRYGEFYCLHKEGRLLRRVNEYLIYKISHSKRAGGKLDNKSQRQYAYVMKELFTYFDINDLKWDEINTDCLRFFVDDLDDMNEGQKRQRLNYKSFFWSEFYQWCDKKGYENNVRLNYNEVIVPQSKDDDMLAHIYGVQKISMRSELYKPFSKKEKVRFINEETLTVLLDALGDDDIVYGAIGYFMVTSGLRIGGALQMKMNSLPNYATVPHLKWVEYKYIPKGKVDTRELKYSMQAWMHLCEMYLSTVYERGEKHFELTSSVPKEFFLKSTSNPVRNFDVWEAFKRASKKINTKVTPHMLRHTFAVYFIKQYAKSKGISPSVKEFLWDAHEQLKSILGHTHIETTMLYCKAASELESFSLLDEISNEIVEALKVHKTKK